MAYIGKSPSRGVRNRFQYQATASQTSFSGADANGLTLTYTDSLYMDVYQNGILLVPGDDYTATTGTTVVLVQGASVDDIVEMVVYDVFSVNDSVSASSGGTFSGNVNMGGTLGVTGASTLTGAVSTGAGLTVANGITLTDGNLAVASGHGIDFSATANSSATNATMASELLDDYEEGTWTPTVFQGWTSVSFGFQNSSYLKIGNMCYLTCSIQFSGTSSGNQIKIDGLPFTPQSNANGYGSGTGAIGYQTMSTVTNSTAYSVYIVQNLARIQFYTMAGATINSSGNASNRWLEFSATYPTV